MATLTISIPQKMDHRPTPHSQASQASQTSQISVPKAQTDPYPLFAQVTKFPSRLSSAIIAVHRRLTNSNAKDSVNKSQHHLEPLILTEEPEEDDSLEPIVQTPRAKTMPRWFVPWQVRKKKRSSTWDQQVVRNVSVSDEEEVVVQQMLAQCRRIGTINSYSMKTGYGFLKDVGMIKVNGQKSSPLPFQVFFHYQNVVKPQAAVDAVREGNFLDFKIDTLVEYTLQRGEENGQSRPCAIDITALNVEIVTKGQKDILLRNQTKKNHHHGKRARHKQHKLTKSV